MDARIKSGHDSGKAVGPRVISLYGAKGRAAGTAARPLGSLALSLTPAVIPGLDPGIHGAGGTMAARIKSGHDSGEAVGPRVISLDGAKGRVAGTAACPLGSLALSPTPSVIPGLDPGIHRAAGTIDARIESGDDSEMAVRARVISFSGASGRATLRPPAPSPYSLRMPV